MYSYSTAKSKVGIGSTDDSDENEMTKPNRVSFQKFLTAMIYFFDNDMSLRYDSSIVLVYLIILIIIAPSSK